MFFFFNEKEGTLPTFFDFLDNFDNVLCIYTPLFIRPGDHVINVYFKPNRPSVPLKWGSSFYSETWLCEVCYRVAAGSFLWRQHIVWLLNAFCHMPLVTLKDTQVMEWSQFFSLLPSSREFICDWWWITLNCLTELSI